MRDWTGFESSCRGRFPEYSGSHFDIFWSEGQVSTLAGEGIIQGPLPESDLVIITAYNPGQARPSAEENQKANEKLGNYLKEAGLMFYQAVGRDPQHSHSEPSFAVVLETGPAKYQLAFLCSLAGCFQQAAVFCWDCNSRTGRTLWLAGVVET